MCDTGYDRSEAVDAARAADAQSLATLTAACEEHSAEVLRLTAELAAVRDDCARRERDAVAWGMRNAYRVGWGSTEDTFDRLMDDYRREHP